MFGVVVVAYGNLAATIAVQRADGVLKRMRSTPLDPSLFVGGQVLSIVSITVLISFATMVWRGPRSAPYRDPRSPNSSSS